MKTTATHFITLSLSALSAYSCAVCHYAETRIDGNLAITRSVYVHADSTETDSAKSGNMFRFDTEGWTIRNAEEPFNADFYGETEVMNLVAQNHSGNFDGVSFRAKEEPMKDNPVLSPEETVEKKFRWFFTRYDYSAKYHAIKGFPIEPGEYMDSLEIVSLFREGHIPTYWNGMEVYSRLDELNGKFMKWYGDCMYKVAYDLVYKYSDERMREYMKRFSENVKTELGKTFKMQRVDPAMLCSILDRKSESTLFSGTYSRNKENIDREYSELTVIPEYYFSAAFVNELEMPGRLSNTNAPEIVDGKPRWKVDGYRLLAGELVITASFRKINPLPVAVTFILIASILYAVFRRLFI